MIIKSNEISTEIATEIDIQTWENVRKTVGDLINDIHFSFLITSQVIE